MVYNTISPLMERTGTAQTLSDNMTVHVNADKTLLKTRCHQHRLYYLATRAHEPFL